MVPLSVISTTQDLSIYNKRAGKMPEQESNKNEAATTSSVATTSSNKVERIRHESQLSRKFLEVAQRRLDFLTKTSDNSSFRLQPKEQEILLAANNFGLVEGALVGAVSLIALRRLRSTFYRNIVNSTSQRVAAPHPSKLVRTIGWGIDGTVAFFIGASASFYMTDTTRILQLLATIPLVEGHSVIAKEFCPDFMEYYKKKLSPEDKNYVKHAESPQLQAINQFIRNCQKRSKYEERLRKEKGVLSKDFPVSIPVGGVPTFDDAGDDDIFGVGDSYAEEYYDPTRDFEDTDFHNEGWTNHNDDDP